MPKIGKEKEEKEVINMQFETTHSVQTVFGTW